MLVRFPALSFCLFWLFSVALGQNPMTPPDSAKPSVSAPKVIVIPIEDQVDFGLHAFLKRAVDEALAQKPDYLVFQVNTYGGELQSAFDIVDLISGITACSTYVYVEKKAISAGALISLSCRRMAMGVGTTIGDCAPITQSQDGIQMLGEKIQSPLRAKFRNLAERNGYPSLLSEAMVSMDLGVVGAFFSDSARAPEFFTAKQWEALPEASRKRFANHKLILQEGQLLTLTDGEAKQYGFSQGSFTSLEAFLAHKGWAKHQTLATTWSEDLVRFLGTIAPLLMMVGFGALYLEFKTPGMSVFGLIGFLCLAVVFGSKFAIGLAHYTELLLLLAGFALFMAEMWLFPGTFVLASLGLLAMMIAIVLSLQSFVLPDPEMPWEMRGLLRNLAVTASMATLALALPFLAAKWLLPRLPGGFKMVSDATLAGATSVAEAFADLQIGQRGVAHTAMRPAGKAEFGGKTYEAQSRGEFVEKGAAVSIVRLTGNIITIRADRAQENA